MTKKEFKRRLEAIGYDFDYISPEVKEAISDCYDAFHQKKQKTDLYSKLMDLYYKFVNRVHGIPPKISGAEGKALKSIIAYLRQHMTDDEAYSSMHHMFLKWGELDDFLQKQLKLTQISSNLTNIFIQLKNGTGDSKNNNKTGVSTDYLQEIHRDLSPD